MRCPKSRVPIQIIVFDVLELIIFVSQGLTLSTASLVLSPVTVFTHFSTAEVSLVKPPGFKPHSDEMDGPKLATAI